ncbi:MAG: transcription termination/antitermination protein NusG [Oscillospiraceae bacterium]|jgi:transcriptional antiterminator NusG|nr:transcription termination/antitermination protein NusG [Oscillospiraceae bacterium]
MYEDGVRGNLTQEIEPKWYVVHTHSGYENKVASNIEKVVRAHGLSDFVREVFIPTQVVSEIKNNETREVEKKVFPGYLLIKMVLNNDTWYAMRNIKGCTGFVGASTKPIPLTDDEVKKFGANREKIIEVSYKVGDSVQIMSGPLEDLIGTVTKLDKQNNCVSVVVSMFGRETPVELELNQVKALG